MKIDEFIEKVNRVGYAKQSSSGNIAIYEKKQETLTNDWFLCLDPRQESLNEATDWIWANGLGTVDLFYILGLVQELRKTPAKDRFSKKKYCLVAHPDSLKRFGTDDFKYVFSIEDGSDGFKFVYGAPTTFTESELNGIKRLHPFLVPTIDGMKEKVKDDDAC